MVAASMTSRQASGNGHEETLDLGVGDRNGTARSDLLAEAGNDRTVGTQHVAETRGDELGATLDDTLLDGQTQRLDVDFGEPLGAAHDIGRIDGLVGGDHHHALHAVFDTLVGHVARTGHVDQHRFARVLLHERHMLVGRRVEHHLRMVGAEDVVQPRRDADIADDGHEMEVGVLVLELETQVVQGSFGVVEENQPADPELHQLAAQFRTDRPGRTGHQHDLVLEVGDDLLHRDFESRDAPADLRS